MAGIVTQSLHLARRLGTAKLGRVAWDGTKLEANASKHKAMRYARLVDKEQHFEAEIAELEAAAAALPADAAAVEDEKFGCVARRPICPARWTGGRSAWRR